MSQDKIELRPCPFCGGPASLYKGRKFDGETSYEMGNVKCLKCGARTNDFVTGGYYGLFATDEQVADAWNKRAPTKQESDCDTCATKSCNARSASVVRINCPLWRAKG